jgi:hypothetical protein
VCKELGYGLDKMAEMLRPGGQYDPELVAMVMCKTNCSDGPKIRRMLDVQARPQLLTNHFSTSTHAHTSMRTQHTHPCRACGCPTDPFPN